MHFWHKLSWKWLLVVSIFALPILLLIIQPGFWVSDDGEWLVIRLSAFYHELGSGQFPVRLLSRLNHEYGYPVANFLYPGYLYLGSVIHALGFGVVDSVKILFSLSILVLGFSLFLWLKKDYQPRSALVGSLVGMYSPYLLFDVFRRGSIGEVLALAFAALTLLTIERKRLILSSIVYAALVLSHNILAIMITPLLIIYAWFRERMLVTSFVFGLGISAFFWLPALFETRFTIFNQVLVSDWRHYMFRQDALALVVSLSVVFLPVAVLLLNNRVKQQKPVIYLMLAFVGATLFLASPLSSFIWEQTPLGRFVQFPWRFLSVTVFSLPSLIAAYSQSLTRKELAGLGLILFLFCSTSLYVNWPRERVNKDDSFYETNDATTTVQNEYLPIWAKNLTGTRPAKKIASLYGTSEINLKKYKSSRLEFTVHAATSDVLDIHTLYYPGWIVERQNQTLSPAFVVDHGYIKIPVLPGEEHFLVAFKETQERLFADAISLLSLVSLLTAGLWQRRSG